MIYLTDAAGQCVYTSAEWEKLTGQGSEHARGRGWLARVHPDDRAIAERILEDAAQQAGAFDIRYRLLKPDDTCRWITTDGIPSFGAPGDTFAGYMGTISEPVPHPATTPANALDVIADHLLIAHSLIGADRGWEA